MKSSLAPARVLSLLSLIPIVNSSHTTFSFARARWLASTAYGPTPFKEMRNARMRSPHAFATAMALQRDCDCVCVARMGGREVVSVDSLSTSFRFISRGASASSASSASSFFLFSSSAETIEPPIES